MLEPPRLASDALAGVTVVLDPGHGGADPGATHGGIVEAALAYRLAATCASVLRRAGARVETTVRSSALSVPLEEGREEPALELPRDARFASDGGAVGAGREEPEHLYRRAATAARVWRARRRGEEVVFVSLHFDAAPSSRVRGGFVCWDRRGSAPRLAGTLARWLSACGMAGSRGAWARELGVLNPQRNPVPERILAEMATLTSPEDRRAVSEPAWRWRAARVVAAAIAGREPPPAP